MAAWYEAVVIFFMGPHSRGLGLLGLLLLVGLQDCIMASPSKSVPREGVPAPGARTAGESETLRAAAARAHKHVGTALVTWSFNEPNYKDAAAHHFDSLTPENEMKWYAVHPAPDRFAFEAGDRLVAFASENGMRVRGHTLVWHSQLAGWAKELSGNALHEAMLRHVQTVAGHYKGKVAQWDVVNEALAEGSSGGLRGSSPFTALGPSYIDDAFRAAHEADPDALLFYNDYEIEDEGTPKTEAAFELVKRLKESGVPIHGVGFQMHVDPRRWPTSATIQKNLARFAALGLLVEITEMDVPVGEIAGTPEEKLQAQKVITHDIVKACMAIDRCSGVTFWGLTDKHSWLASAEWGRLRGRLPHYPLPLDSNYARKPMYEGIVDALNGR